MNANRQPNNAEQPKESKQAPARLDGEWRAIVTEARKRQQALSELGYQTGTPDGNLTLVNVFVEKAQRTLQRRARWNFALGLSCIIGAVLTAAVYFSVSFDVELFYAFWNQFLEPDLLPRDYKVREGESPGDYAIVLLQMTGLTAAALGSSTYLFLLSRAFLHEWAKAHNQVHAIRFGRLGVTLLDKLDGNSLRQLFSWNIDASTGFVREPFQSFYRTAVTEAFELVKSTMETERKSSARSEDNHP
jgi:hypothetical protein